jgi:peroxiredoxin
MKTILIPSVIAICVVLSTLRGMAQQSSAIKALEDRFKVLDKNGDGKITNEELPQSRFFKQRDKNGDGEITFAEAKAELEGRTYPISTPSITEIVPPKQPVHNRSPQLAPQRVQPLKGGDHGVGRMIEDVVFTKTDGVRHKLSSFAKQRAVVFAMTSTSCPLSKKYLSTLSNLAKKYSQLGVSWVLVNPIATDTPEDIEAAANSLSGIVIYVHDRDGTLANAVGARTTTDVIVVDSARTVVFHGAIDDQYGLGYSTAAPRRHFLADALDALLRNEQPLVTATEAPGCSLDFAPNTSTDVSINYHNRISRIMQTYCVECHRDDGPAPFQLTTYEDVVAHAGMISQVVESGTMPPWFAAPLSKAPEGHRLWANDRSLAEADKADLLHWLSGGKPEGDKRDGPIPHSYTKGWAIGQPDAVFEFSKPVAIKATGIMPYQNVVVETKLTEDKWVQAIEVQPGNRDVVHHILVYLQSEEKERMTARDEAVDERLGFWAVYVPGNATLVYPKGFAKFLPRKANLRCQVHYVPSGTATTDQSRIGVVYAKQAPLHEVRVAGICNDRIEIPPGAEHHREYAMLRLPFDIEVLSFLPHMHLRAKSCRYSLVKPNGDVRILLDIPKYDFNWQLLYRYYEPQRFSRGDVIKFTARYDNSRKNPANPDPDQTVRWGKQISDEMHLGYFEYFIPTGGTDKSLTSR